MRIFSLSNYIEEYLISGLLFFSTLIIFLSILYRELLYFEWFFPISEIIHFSWSQELSIYCLIWMVIFGVSYGVKKGLHIGVDILVSNLVEPYKKFMINISFLISIILFSFLFLLSLKWMIFIFNSSQVSPDLEIPMWVVYGCLPIGTFLVIIRLLQVFYSFLNGEKIPNVNKI